MSELCVELEKVAKENCNETTDIRENSLASLHVWLKKTAHLKARSNDEWLLAFLRYCCFSLEDTKKRLDSFYTLKVAFPEVLMNRTLDDSLLTLYRQGIHTIPLKPVSPGGPCLVISQYSKYDPKKVSPNDIFKLLFMLLEMMANEVGNASVSGVVYIVDARDVTMEQMMQYHPSLLKKIWMLIEHCFPLHFAEIHLINMRKEGRNVFNFVTQFLPNKTTFKSKKKLETYVQNYEHNRKIEVNGQETTIKFVVHRKAEDLYEHIPRDAMTVEYGGHNGYQAEALKHWETIMLKYKDYFAIDDNYGTNDRLRVGISASLEVSQLTGLNGSFRKLEVD